MLKTTELYAKLRPFIQRQINESAQGGATIALSSGSTGTFEGIKDPAGTGVVENVTGWILTTDDGVVNVDAGGASTLAFSVSQGSITHNNLAGLTTGDPHTQYPLLSGTETITGAWSYSRGAAAPFAVNSGALVVANLDADKVDGYHMDQDVRTTGSPSFAGLTVNGAITVTGNVDGVDVSAHAADANAHHNQAHVLATTSGLGPDHTVIGLTSGQVLRATGAATAAFAAIEDADLPSTIVRTSRTLTAGAGLTGGGDLTADRAFAVGAGLGITVNADDVALTTPGTLTVSTANNSTGSHLHTITSSSNPGAAASLLATDASGFLILVKLSTDTLADKSGGNLNIAPAGDVVFDPTGNDLLPASNYDLNMGAINKKYLTLHAAELWVETLVAQETIATIGGRILVGPTTMLTRDMGTGDTTIYVKHNEMASGDRAYMEAQGKVEFFAITSAPTEITPSVEYSYTVTRDLDGTGANLWYAGDALFNTGTTGDGFIDLYSLRSVKSATQYGPAIVGNVRNSATFNDWSEHWAIGNLNGVYGYGATTYGFAAGKYASGQPWIGVDATNGFRVMRHTTQMAQWDISGNIIVGQVANSKSRVEIDDTNGIQLISRSAGGVDTTAISLTHAGAATFAGSLTVGIGGVTRLKVSQAATEEGMFAGSNVAAGAVSFAAILADNVQILSAPGEEEFDTGDVVIGDYANANVLWDASAGQLKFRDATTVQAYVDTDGSIKAGAGAVTLDVNGLTVTYGNSAGGRIRIMDGSTKTFDLYGATESFQYNTYLKFYPQSDATGGNFIIMSHNTAGVETGRVIFQDDSGINFQGPGTALFNKNVTLSTDYVLTLPNTGLHLLDTNASHDLIIAPGSDLTADRTLTVTTGDANRTLTLTGNATINQDVSTVGSPTFVGATINAASGVLAGNILTVKGGGTSGAFGFSVQANNGDVILQTNNATYDITMATVAGGVSIGAAGLGEKLSVYKSLAGYSATAYNPSTISLLTDDSTGYYSGIRFSGSGGVREAMFGVVATAATTGDFVWQGYTGVAYLEYMRVKSNGNVLIGTTTDSGHRLNINSPIVLATEDYSGIHLQTSNYGYVIEGGLKQSSGGTLRFSVNNNGVFAEKLRITASGDVGIGNTNPGYKLEVTGSIKSSAAIVSSTLSVTNAAEISVLEIGSTGNIYPGESLYVQNNARVNGTAQFVSDAEVLGNLTVAGYLSKSRTWNQSIAGSSSWSTGYTINAGEFYIVNVVYMETSNGAPQALSTWQMSRSSGGNRVDLVWGSNSQYTVTINGSNVITINNSNASTRYFSVSLLRTM